MRTPGPHNDLRDQHESWSMSYLVTPKVIAMRRALMRKDLTSILVMVIPLVSGSEASQLEAAMFTWYEQGRLAIVEGKSLKPITSNDIDGKIGAMLDKCETNISQASWMNLDVWRRLSEKVNSLQSQGLDLMATLARNISTRCELWARREITRDGWQPIKGWCCRLYWWYLGFERRRVRS